MKDRITFTGNVSAEGRRIRGSVKLAGARTWRNNEYVEIDPAALSRADITDVVARWNHDEDKILGRTTNGTLKVTFTDDGIAYETTDLPNTTSANDTLELLRGGYVDGSSFEIEGLKFSRYTDDDGSPVLRYTDIDRINDVSPTPHPAFESSMAAAFRKENNPVSDNPTPEVTEPAAPVTTTVDPAPTVNFAVGRDPWDIEAFKRTARDLTTEQIANVMDNIMSETKGELFGEMLARYEAFATVYAERVSVSTEEKERAARMKALHDLRLGRIKAPSVESGLLQSDDYSAAFTRYLRGNLGALEQFAQSIAGDGTQGGYMVPDGFRNKITETMAAFGGIESVAEVITTDNGQALPWPTNNDTANSAAIASEGSAPASGGADLVFGEVRLLAHSYAASGTSNAPLKVSRELLQDAAFDVESFVARKLGERLQRKMAADFANGTGSGSAPVGLLTKSPDTVTATTTYAAAVEMEFHVNSAYRETGNCVWVMSDTTAVKYRSAVDDNNRPLWLPEAQSGMEGRPSARLLGYPVILDQAAGNNVAFGDISRGFIIRKVKGVEVLVNPYTSMTSRQIEFNAWARADANIQDSAAYSVGDFSSVTADAVISG